MKVIVTGCEGLIGSEVSRYFAEKGHEVVKIDFLLGHDLTHEPQVKGIFGREKADALVNLFALQDHVDENSSRRTLFDIPLASFHHFMTVNVVALFSACREYARNNDKGSIVNFSSTYGLGSPHPRMYAKGEKHIGYGVSKAAVVQLTRHLAVHLAPAIRVNCIAPGGVRHRQGEDFQSAYGNRTPMQRMMEVGELNGMVEYLCSDASSYVTGAVFCCDGGWTAW